MRGVHQSFAFTVTKFTQQKVQKICITNTFVLVGLF